MPSHHICRAITSLRKKPTLDLVEIPFLWYYLREKGRLREGKKTKENFMNTFSMTCTCGDVMKVEASSREEAVQKMKAMMTEDMIAQHTAEKHPGEPAPSLEQTHMMIEKTIQLVTM